ncbi:hypothetical protein P3T43_001518 [Paraburkholderia sp. GAS41]|jgi:hypothetical protein
MIPGSCASQNDNHLCDSVSTLNRRTSRRKDGPVRAPGNVRIKETMS